MLSRTGGQRLHLVVGSPWKEALGVLQIDGGTSTKDLWFWRGSIARGDLLLTLLDTEPRMFACIETTSDPVEENDDFLPIDEFQMLPRLVPVTAVSRRLGQRAPTKQGVVGDALADKLLAALQAELDDPTPLRVTEGRRRTSTTRERSSALQAEALRLASSICGGCDRDFSDMLEGRGLAALDVHHLRPFQDDGDEERESTLNEVVVVCGACHRLLHSAGSPTLQDIRYAWRPPCPACCSRTTKAIMWGMPSGPVPDDVAAWGCDIPPNPAHWLCGSCEHSWTDAVSR